MDYGMAVLTALATFISPCVLPLLPVYVSYFAAGEANRWKTLFNTLAFCAAVTLFFMAIFATASFAGFALSRFIAKYKSQIFVVCGIVLILFGLKFMGYLNLPFLDKTISFKAKTENINILNAFVLGLVFSFSMGMCALGFMSYSLLGVITESDNFFKGLLIGIIFTGTLDILFIACAMLIDQLKGMFNFIKKHYKVINMVAGILLVVLGVLVALGLMEKINFGFTF